MMIKLRILATATAILLTNAPAHSSATSYCAFNPYLAPCAAYRARMGIPEKHATPMHTRRENQQHQGNGDAGQISTTQPATNTGQQSTPTPSTTNPNAGQPVSGSMGTVDPDSLQDTDPNQ